jgi:hypothetical protein
MATHPDDPRKPDEPEPARHEAQAQPPEEPAPAEAPEAVVQGPGGSIDDSDSAIELGLPAGSGDILSDSDLHPPAAESGITSGIAWAALMEEIPEPAADEIRIDSPSDADLLAEPPPLPSKAPPIGSEHTLIAPPAELSSFPPHRPGVPPPAPPKSGDLPPTDPFEPRDIFTAEPTGRYPRPDTGLGTTAEAPAAQPTPSDSARVDLGAPPPRSAVSGGVESSIIDLGAIDFPSQGSPSGSVEEAELASESSGIDLTAEPVSGTGSGRDLIAEALESGIKFGPPPEPSDTGAAAASGESPIDFTGAPTAPRTPQPQAGSPFSSAIEFGGPSQKPATPVSPPPVQSPTGSAISSAIDYGGPSNSQQDSSSSVQLAPDMPDDLQPFEVRPPTLNPESGRPATLNPESGRPATHYQAGSRPPTLYQDGGRPPTLYQESGRPKTEPSTPEEMEAVVQAGAGSGPADSEVDLGSHPSSGDFEPFEGPGSPKPVKTDSDSDIDINIGQLPEGSEEAGSGLFVNANSGRLEPTDAAIDLDAEAFPEDETAVNDVLVSEPEEVAAEKPPAKKRQFRLSPGSVPWVGGGVIGAVAGSAALLLLQMLFGGSSPAPKSTPLTQTPPPVVATVADPVVSKFDHLQNGDLDKAAQAGIEQIDENNAEQIAHRGEYRWLAYLQKQRLAKAALNGEDPVVKQAGADLQAAADKGNPDALFWLGHLQESTNALDKAKETYAKGAKLEDKQQKLRFNAALQRLELREGDRPAGAARGPDVSEALLLALIALQAPAPAAAPAADADEAGFGFWEAARLAQDQKYAEAVQLLDKARAAHDQRRFTRLRKAQNPLSDPTEEIFLHSADELKAYWQLQDKLRSGGYLDLAMHRDPAKAVEVLIAQSKEGVTAKAQVEKLTKERQKIEADLAKLDAGLNAARAEAAAKAKAADARSAAEEQKVTAAEKRAEVEGAKLQALEVRERGLAAEKAAADAELDKVARALTNAKFLDPRTGKAGVVQGVQAAIRVATAGDSQGLVRTLQAEANRLREQLLNRRRPSDMLTYWLPLLQDRSRTDLAEQASSDALRVANDPESTPAEKARAQAIHGLALRNLGHFSSAKSALRSASGLLVQGDVNWREPVESALKEMADPVAYYAARSEELQSRGKTKEAIAELEKAEKAEPSASASIHAMRGLLHLEAARAKADRGAANDPELQVARTDINEAAKSGDAFAFYAAGRLAEDTGDNEAAVANFRKALAAHSALDATGSRYRLALARALTRSSAAATPSDAPKPAAKPGQATGRALPPMDTVLLALAVALQAPVSPANQSEAIQLADEVLNSPSSTLEMQAQALAIKGMYTQALLTYADALRPALTRAQVETLKQLIQNHPALSRPESQSVANPQAAERRYATGLRLLYSGRYAAAEKELLAAVEQDGQDARYYYFLGLARHYQGKRNAFEDFEQAARLEQQGQPSREAVDSALERVQGSPRRPIDSARGTPR